MKLEFKRKMLKGQPMKNHQGSCDLLNTHIEKKKYWTKLDLKHSTWEYWDSLLKRQQLNRNKMQTVFIIRYFFITLKQSINLPFVQHLPS